MMVMLYNEYFNEVLHLIPWTNVFPSLTPPHPSPFLIQSTVCTCNYKIAKEELLNLQSSCFTSKMEFYICFGEDYLEF